MLTEVDVAKGSVVRSRKLPDETSGEAAALPDNTGILVALSDGTLLEVRF